MLGVIIFKFSLSLGRIPTPISSKCKFILHNKKLVRCASTEINQKVIDNTIPVENIRNFCIVAHVDHGKSTLADRLLEIMAGITVTKENQQILDRLPVEKERGITVKSVSASLTYTHKGTDYLLNLIDTPGHVDFSNEVNRYLFACQGVILLVDASQGVQAQTIANFYSAFVQELTIIPVLNKIDLPSANPEAVEKDLKTLFGFSKSEILRISAKTGFGIEDLLKAILETVPPPNVTRDGSFKALLIDSWFDKYRGAILFIYVDSGSVKVGDTIVTYKGKTTFTVKSTAKLTPEEVNVNHLLAGQVGVIGCNIRNINAAQVGDTLHAVNVEVEPLKSFDSSKPMVFAGIYPQNQSEQEALKSALEKLCLNDPAVTMELEPSPALGLGWRLGFLGLLHLDVFRQRLEQEFNTEAIITAPAITYKVKVKGQKNIKTYGGEIVEIKNPVLFPDPSIIESSYEPVVLGTVITPLQYFQTILDECLSRRGKEEDITSLDGNRIMLKFIIPLSEIIFDFHDKLKKLSSGFASFDYEDKGYMEAPLEKVRILLNGKDVEELTLIVHKSRARDVGLRICTKLEELIPMQMIQVRIQAVVNSKVIVSKTIKAYKKNVVAKLYGGDVTRKMKLLNNQKRGKKKMRMFLNIEIDRDTFRDVLKE